MAARAVLSYRPSANDGKDISFVTVKLSAEGGFDETLARYYSGLSGWIDTLCPGDR
jgi:hypothetical protein